MEELGVSNLRLYFSLGLSLSLFRLLDLVRFEE